MGLVYTVKQGDCLSSIAAAHGFARWQTIYEHARNEELRRQRPNPNIIHPGDAVYIPDKQQKQAPRPAGKTHVFSLRRRSAMVRVVLADDEGRPLSGKRYELVVGGQTQAGTVPEDGLVQRRIPLSERTGTLRLWLNGGGAESPPDIEWELEIGHLDPVEEVTGTQARLENLGYPCGGVDGRLGPRTAAAIRAFQHDSGLEVTGKMDVTTCAALRRAHEEGS